MFPRAVLSVRASCLQRALRLQSLSGTCLQAWICKSPKCTTISKSPSLEVGFTGSSGTGTFVRAVRRWFPIKRDHRRRWKQSAAQRMKATRRESGGYRWQADTSWSAAWHRQPCTETRRKTHALHKPFCSAVQTTITILQSTILTVYQEGFSVFVLLLVLQTFQYTLYAFLIHLLEKTFF